MSARSSGHGTRACYLRGCRRDECLAAHVGYAANRRRQIAYGSWDPLTDAEPARIHLKELEAAGVTWQQAAAIAGVELNSVRCLMFGAGTGSPPSRRLRHSVAAALLAVTPQSDLPRGALVDATGSRRRVQALFACGWPAAYLAEALGTSATTLRCIQVQRCVQEATRRAVAALYDRLWDQAPPLDTSQARSASARAARKARRNGWPPPQAWDDEVIDDPEGGPAEGSWIRPKRLSSQEIAEEAADLFRQGLDRHLAAERLGMLKSSLDTVLAREQKRQAS